MPNPGLQQGILMHQGKLMELQSTLDMTHIAALEAPKEPTHYGTIDLWANKRKADVPFLTVAGIGSNNIMYVNGDWFTYDVPAMRDGSTTVAEDISGDDQAGRGKTPFEMLVQGNHLPKGQIFKFDLQLKDEFMVLDYREASGNQEVITVVRRDSDEPINKMWLQNGNKILPLATVMSEEFGQEFADFKIDASSGPKYKIPVGQMTTQVNYHVTTKVAKIDKLTLTGAQKTAMDDAFEYYFKIPGMDDSGLTTLQQGLGSEQAGAIQAARNAGTVSVAISTLYDSLCLKFLARGEQEYMVYGTGGAPVKQGGMDEELAPVGAWQQLDTGFKTTFNLANFGLHTIEAMIQEYFHGREDTPSAGNEPVLEIQTGRGGFQLAQKMIAAQANNNSLIVNARDFNQITGAGPFNLGYSPLWYSEITIPMLCKLRFVYNGAFDPIETNPLTNPKIAGGYNLTSYSMIIYPENQFGGSGNIKILRNQEDGGKVYMNVINGRSVGHPLVSGSRGIGNGITATSSAHLGTGYQATFTKKMDSLWVVDPTRILKAVPINPYTKKTF
jgi:hypothetical protein